MTKQRSLYLAVLIAFAIIAAFAVSAEAQDMKKQVLRPPKGAKVAIVVFEDLQCPDCARAEPLLQEAVRAYKVPLVRRDFPLQMHNWARQGAILARWFDTQNKKKGQNFGEEFRGHLLANQKQITPENIRSVAEKFAASRGLALPFAIDPQGKLEAKVNADVTLGKQIGIAHTPTIYVVTNKLQGEPFVEVVDRSQLFALIEEMKKEVGAK